MICSNFCEHCMRFNSYNPEYFTGIRISYKDDGDFIDHLCEVMLQTRKLYTNNIDEETCLYYIKFYNLFLATNLFAYIRTTKINTHGISIFFRNTLLKNDAFKEMTSKYNIKPEKWAWTLHVNYGIDCPIYKDVRSVVKEYHPNGKEKTEVKFIISGKKSGKFREWYDNGVLMTDGTYKCDKKDEVWTVRYENGNIMETGLYMNNIKRNEWKYYYETGLLKEVGRYETGKKNGFWKEYSEDNVEIIKEYKKGKLVVSNTKTVKRRTESECLIYKDIPSPGQTYLTCKVKREHVMDYEFMIKFKNTKLLKDVKCVYCGGGVTNMIYDQV